MDCSSCIHARVAQQTFHQPTNQPPLVPVPDHQQSDQMPLPVPPETRYILPVCSVMLSIDNLTCRPFERKFNVQEPTCSTILMEAPARVAQTFLHMLQPRPIDPEAGSFNRRGFTGHWFSICPTSGEGHPARDNLPASAIEKASADRFLVPERHLSIFCSG